MGVDTTMAVLYAQSGLSNQANVAMVAPQASLAVTRMLAIESMRQERQQVAKGEKTEGATVGKDGGGNKGLFGSRRRMRRVAQEQEADGERPSPSPIVGNLLNVKV